MTFKYKFDFPFPQIFEQAVQGLSPRNETEQRCLLCVQAPVLCLVRVPPMAKGTHPPGPAGVDVDGTGGLDIRHSQRHHQGHVQVRVNLLNDSV